MIYTAHNQVHKGACSQRLRQETEYGQMAKRLYRQRIEDKHKRHIKEV